MNDALTLYGIAQCGSCQKARAWLREHGLAHVFHDFRKDGLDADWLAWLCGQVGVESLINRRGTTYRQLDPALKTVLSDAQTLALIQQHPTLIKRPVLVQGNRILTGFSPESYAELT